MAITTFLYYFLVFLVWPLNELCVYGARELINDPNTASKCPATLHGGSQAQGLRVAYKGGPCSSLGNPRQILRFDQSRVDSINSLKSNPTHITSNLMENKLDSSIKGSPLDVGVFSVRVGFGTPPQNFDLLLDTGSDLTWVQSNPCPTCKNESKIFNPSKSSTFSNHSCGISPQKPNFNITYGDSSYSRGYYGCDTITLPPKTYQNYRFGCSSNPSDNNLSGILGLNSDGDAFGKMFCYCLPNKESTEGYLHFDQEARTQCKTDKSISLLIKSFYYVNLIGISVGQKRLEISSSFSSNPSTIIDSGTVITRLPSSVYSELRSAFNVSMSQYLQAEAVDTLDTCYNMEGHKNPIVPQVVLHFENSNDIRLDSDKVLYKGSKDTEVFCLAFAAKKNESDYNIIGSYQQRNLNILYDLQNEKLGFGMGNC